MPYPQQTEERVSHEKINNAHCVVSRGELRSELLSCLRQRRLVRRARGEDRRSQIQDMTTLHVWPPEVEDRLIPRHTETTCSKTLLTDQRTTRCVEITSRRELGWKRVRLGGP
jgi:IS30 family transposase